MDRALRIALAFLTIAAAVAIVIGGVWIFTNRHKSSIITSYVTTENQRVENVMGVANETMAVEEDADTATMAVQREELKHAEIVRPGGLTARQRRGCIILRQQGQDLAKVAACRSMSSGGKR